MRTFVVINVYNGVDLCENILKWIPEQDNIIVYMRESLKESDYCEKIKLFRGENGISVRFYEDELRFYGSKLKNLVSKELIEEKTPGFVHVIDDTIQIYNKIDDFLVKIEEMMDVFQLKSWLETSCDQCNYIYSKYNPRLYIMVDEEEARKRYDSIIAWCSNANTLWVVYNMDICTFEDIRFEEKFRSPMYYIIEFLARRRNTKKRGELDYMNYYPSVREELDLFRCLQIPEERPITQKEMEEEGLVFQGMKIDNYPDTDIDILMEDMRNMIMKKEPKK